jgi:hypothetical protein
MENAMTRRRKPPSATAPLTAYMNLGDMVLVALAAFLLLAASAYIARAAEVSALIP